MYLPVNAASLFTSKKAVPYSPSSAGNRPAPGRPYGQSNLDAVGGNPSPSSIR